MKACAICGRVPAESHHIVFRSQNKPMIKAPINHIYLCPKHHRETNGVHGKEGHKLDMQLKLQLQKKLFELFDKDYYSKKDIKELLGISNKDVDMLTKMLKHYPRGYKRVDIVRNCMGGMLYAN